MNLYINSSPARKYFKLLLGNANQLIITALVGLNAVERGIISEVPEGIHAAWSPKDLKSSAQRSRRLILDMALLRAVDALDVYIKKSNRKPFLIEDGEVREKIDGDGRSVLKKFTAIKESFDLLDMAVCSLVEIMIARRNKCAHEEADISIDPSVKTILGNDSERISKQFSGLDCQVLISRFESDEALSFKETTSLIHATHEVVQTLDGLFLGSCSPERYLKEHVWYWVAHSNRLNSAKSNFSMERFQNIWGKDISERAYAFVKFLRSTGFSNKSASDAHRVLTFDG